MQYTIDDFTQDFYTTGEVANFFKVSPKTIQKWDNTGVLKFSRTSTDRRVLTKDALIAALDAKEMYHAVSKASIESQFALNLINSKNFSDGFFPVAVSNETGGVPIMCPVTFETKHILGVDFSGEQQSYSQKHGVEVGEDVICTPHLFINSVDGGSKSVLLEKFAIKGLMNPNWEVIGLDRSGIEFAKFEKYGMKTATTPEEFLNVFKNSYNEVLSRLKTLENEGENHYKHLSKVPPALMIIVNEIGLIAKKHDRPRDNRTKRENQIADEILEYITKISRLGRQVGVHLIIGTYRSAYDSFTEEIRANFSAIMAIGKLNSKQSVFTFGTEIGTKIEDSKGQMYISCHGKGNFGQSLFVIPDELDEYLEARLGNSNDDER